VNIYLSNTSYIKNWDLVDLSFHKKIGAYFSEESDVFWKLSSSESLWENRIAVVSTFNFIKNHSFDLTMRLVGHLSNNPHHLIHKACGWMLREIGKKDESTLINFLTENRETLPKITLRYASERLSECAIRKHGG
jgi:3-methyladenine DNA glycosylase AlkD